MTSHLHVPRFGVFGFPTILMGTALVLAACQEGSFGPTGAAPGGRLSLAACTAAPAGLVSWWPGDGHANDIQGHNHGTLVGNTNYAAGQVGQAFNLDGANDEVDFGNPANLQQTTAITADAWINPDTYTGNFQTIVSKWQQGANTSWGLFVVNNDDLFAILQNSGGAFVQASGGSIPLDAWTHVAMTYSTTDGMRLYVNGVEVATAAANGSIRISTAEVHVGDDNDDTFQREFDGMIDEVEIFDRALSAAEVAAIHAAGAAGKCKPTCDGRVVTTTGTVNGGQIDLTEGNDVWLGTAAGETVLGLGGDDRMCGEGGDDNLLGGAGFDRLFGGDDADVLEGGPDDDRLEGGAGDDELYGATAAAPDAAGSGNDQLRGDRGADQLHGGDGADQLVGEGEADQMDGGAGDDLLRGGDGADVLSGGEGDDELAGNAGNDELYGATAAAPDAAGSGNDQLRGDEGADELHGGDGADGLQGGSGVDLLEGGEGGDQLFGGADDDELNGGAGDDRLRGNAGADAFNGQDGVDRAQDFVCGVDTTDGTVERGIPNCP